MKKILNFLLSLSGLVILCVIATAYVIDLKWQAETDGSRYQLIFGTIIHTNSNPHPDKPGVMIQTAFDRPVCFKFDTVTGETWRYVSDFYQDPNGTSTTKGFEWVTEDPYIYETTEKTNRLAGLLAELKRRGELPEGFVLDEPTAAPWEANDPVAQRQPVIPADPEPDLLDRISQEDTNNKTN